jgi:hypothetical protein
MTHPRPAPVRWRDETPLCLALLADGATFDGTGMSELEATALNGDSPFPSKKRTAASSR